MQTPTELLQEFNHIVEKIDILMPQLYDFIMQFNQVVATPGLNVVTDAGGNMALDVPVSMPDAQAENIGKRLGIIDRLITTRGQEINGLLQRGIKVESSLGSPPELESKILDRIREFERLNAIFRH